MAAIIPQTAQIFEIKGIANERKTNARVFIIKYLSSANFE